MYHLLKWATWDFRRMLSKTLRVVLVFLLILTGSIGLEPILLASTVLETAVLPIKLTPNIAEHNLRLQSDTPWSSSDFDSHWHRVVDLYG